MRRVVSLWFPHWPTDRLHRHRARQQGDAPALPQPSPAALVTAAHDGRRRTIAAMDAAALRLGLRPGMAVAQALAMVPGLDVAESDPQADAAALHRLAQWCHRHAPVVAPCPPDGIWLEIAGAAHLFGGEAAMLLHVLDRLDRNGLQARAAVADTPGAAHAMARHAARPLHIVPPGDQVAATAALPVACLRLPPGLDATLHRLGFEQAGQLARLPRAVLARRFGVLPGLRLDQVEGRVAEPLVPLLPERALQRRECFLDPLLTAEALTIAIDRLVIPLCTQMEREGLGARRLDLMFERTDGHVTAMRVGTVQPSRDAAHLGRMLAERLGTVDPGLGIEAMHLVAPLTEPLRWEQQESGTAPQQMARLVDRLVNRLDTRRVFRAAPVATWIPERLAGKGPALKPPRKLRTTRPPPLPPPCPPKRPGPALTLVASAPERNIVEPAMAREHPPRGSLRLIAVPAVDAGRGTQVVPDWTAPRSREHRTLAADQEDWPASLKAPARLLATPCSIDAIAGLPNEAPATFVWRRRHSVVRSEGPERIHETWWQADHAGNLVRDYFEVEVEGGQRFWLFRRGNGQDLAAGDLSWFLHGVF